MSHRILTRWNEKTEWTALREGESRGGQWITGGDGDHANRLSETRMITAQMEVGKLHCELKKEAEYSARERIGFWKTSHRI